MVTGHKNRALWGAGMLLACEPLYAHTLKVAQGGFLDGIVPHFHGMDFLPVLILVAVIWGWRSISRRKQV